MPYMLLPVLLSLLCVATAASIHSPGSPGDVLDEVSANDYRIPAGALENGTFVVHLAARAGAWRPRLDADTAIRAVAFAERGGAPSIPGPLIRVPQGTEVRLTLRNDIPPGVPVRRPPPRFQDVGLSTVGSDVLIVHGLRARAAALEPGETFDADSDLLFLLGGGVHEGEHWETMLNGRCSRHRERCRQARAIGCAS